MDTFGTYIKKNRLELDLTQAELAKKLGLTQNYIAYLEQDKRKPSNEIVKKISEVLNLSLERLYSLVNPDLETMFARRSSDAIELMNPVLQELKKDKELMKQYHITPAEINLLNSIKAKGKIKNRNDYVFILMTLRQVLKDD